VAGQLVTVDGQAVIVSVRVLKTVDVVISGAGVSTGKAVVGALELIAWFPLPFPLPLPLLFPDEPVD
jgi:hypothetical protein